MFKVKFTISRPLTQAIMIPMIACFLLFGTTSTAHADAWGTNWAAAAWKHIAEKLDWHIEGVINGVFKKAVARIMNTRISVLIGGGGGKGPLFISNWQGFLINDPRQKSLSYMNDFFTMSTRGRNSSANYRPASSGCTAGGFQGTMMNGGCVINSGGKSPVSLKSESSWLTQEGIVATVNAETQGSDPQRGQVINIPSDVFKNAPSTPPMSDDELAYQRKIWAEANQSYSSQMRGNYYKYQTNLAQANLEPSVPPIDLLDYVSNPYDIFTRGNWRGFNSFFSNPSNNPFGYSRLTRDAYQNKLSQEAHVADIKAVAYQGFKAVEGKDGTVKTPGITIGQVVEATQKFNFDNISNAEHMSELLSAGLDAALNMAINSLVNVGLGQIEGVASKFGLNLNLQGSYASTDWNSSGNSDEFSHNLNTFDSDIQSGLTGKSQSWGDFNFKGTDVGSATIPSKQSGYSPLDSGSFNIGSSNFGSLNNSSNSGFGYTPDSLK